MDTEKFIECIKKHPILYNTHHKEYKNAFKKAETWEVIAREMNETSEVLRTKWKGLKDGYTKYKKQTKSGVGSAKAYNNWCWGPHLLFLDNFMKQRKSKSIRIASQDNSFLYSLVSASSTPSPFQPISTTPLLPELLQESETSQDENNLLEPMPSTSATSTPSTSTSTSRTSHRRSGPSRSRAVATKTVDDVEKILNFIRNKRIKKPDAVDHLFMSYAETFKNFSVRTQTIMKVQMAKLFADAELQEHNLNQIQSPVNSVISVDSDFTTSDNFAKHHITHSDQNLSLSLIKLEHDQCHL